MHAGTGGVGSAAMQVARAMSYQVLATAGSTHKRAVLRTSGAAVVAGSRDTYFTELLGCGAPAGTFPMTT